MGTVVVGYVPKPEGEAALRTAIAEAKLRGTKLVVVNSHRGGSDFDAGRRHPGRPRDGRRARHARRVRGARTTSASWCAASSPPRT